MINEAIILIGGLGKRLQSVVKDIPKPLADVGGKPFLWYVLQKLLQENIERIILSSGYKAELVEEFILKYFMGKNIKIIIEKEPLGTGGALKFSIPFINNDFLYLLNGDSFFDINMKKFKEDSFCIGKFDISIALCELKNPDRFGIVEIDKNFNVIDFKEKREKKGERYINTGVYILNKKVIKDYLQNYPTKFSFEKDILEKLKLKTIGVPYKKSFIDIGIPEDYLMAKQFFNNIKK